MQEMKEQIQRLDQKVGEKDSIVEYGMIRILSSTGARYRESNRFSVNLFRKIHYFESLNYKKVKY